MKKLLSIAAASLLIVGCLTGCGKNEDSSSLSEKESPITEESVSEEETSEEASTEEETTEAETTEEETTEADEDETSEEAETEAATMPEVKPDDVKEKDFVGFWECSKMYTGGVEMSGDLYGIPLGVMMQITINEDGTGILGTGLISEDEADNGNQEFNWTFEDNKIKLTNAGEDDDDEPAFAMISDGSLIITDENNLEYIYFTRVDKLSTMSEEEVYSAMGLGDLSSDLESAEETTAE